MIDTRIFSQYETDWLMAHGYEPSQLGHVGDMPVEYITGRAPFCGHEFVVNEHVLIPREETEELVALVVDELAAMSSKVQSLRLVDVGTGSGCIGISVYLALKKLLPNLSLKLICSDVSFDALSVTEQNIKRLIPKEEQCNAIVLQSDVLDKIPQNLHIDCVVANLPYIPTVRLERLPEAVVGFEPHLALDGGDDGLTLINRLLAQAKSLQSTPSVLLEIDDSHVEGVFQYRRCEIAKDTHGRGRFVVIH